MVCVSNLFVGAVLAESLLSRTHGRPGCNERQSSVCATRIRSCNTVIVSLLKPTTSYRYTSTPRHLDKHAVHALFRHREPLAPPPERLRSGRAVAAEHRPAPRRRQRRRRRRAPPSPTPFSPPISLDPEAKKKAKLAYDLGSRRRGRRASLPRRRRARRALATVWWAPGVAARHARGSASCIFGPDSARWPN